MNLVKKSLIAAILCAFIAAPMVAEARFAVFGVRAQSGKLRGETPSYRLSRTSRWSKVTAVFATPRAIGSMVSTRAKAAWNKLLAPKSIADKTARGYISRAVHEKANFNPKLRGKIRVQQSQIAFDRSRTRPNGDIAFTVPVKVRGQAGYTQHGWINTSALRSMPVRDRVEVPNAPTHGIIVK
jgi:hypothetical protein